MELKHIVFYQSILAALQFTGKKGLYTVNRRCNSTGFCLVVYRTNQTDGITWDQSSKACIGEHAALASIPDSVVQSQVEAVLETVPVFGDVPVSHGVWVGGRRRQNDNWMLIDGSTLTGHQVSEPQENGTFCVFMNVDQNNYADNCDETRGNSSALCQYSPGQRDNTCAGFLFSDTCFCVHTDKPGRGDWYDAQSFCHTQFGGDLAYTHIENGTLRKKIIDEYGRQVWIGILRHPWLWENGSPVKYFNWDSTMWTYDGESHKDIDKRILINLDTHNRFKWSGAQSSLQLHHFLCQYYDDSYPGEARTSTHTSSTITISTQTTPDTPITTTTSTHSTHARTSKDPTQTETTSTRMQSDDSRSTTTEENTAANERSESTSSDMTLTLITTSGRQTDDGSFPVIAVAASVAAAVVIVMFIVIVVLVLRKRKAANQTPPANPFDDPVPYASNPKLPEDTPESGYSSVVDNPQYQSKDDLVQPYGEFSPGPSRAAKLKNRVSGLFQGAFWRAQVDQPNTDHTAQDDVKAFYTVPNTSKKNFAGPSKKPKIMTAKPKLKGARKAARPDVAHVEAPTGQIYALSMKNVL